MLSSFCEFPDDRRYRFQQKDDIRVPVVFAASDGRILSYRPEEDDPDKLASIADAIAYYGKPSEPIESKMRESTQESIRNILDTFTNEDGGIKYLYLMKTIRKFEQKAIVGDIKAQAIIDIVNRFSKLIDIAAQESPSYQKTVKQGAD